jgi:hypothetical protein
MADGLSLNRSRLYIAFGRQRFEQQIAEAKIAKGYQRFRSFRMVYRVRQEKISSK